MCRSYSQGKYSKMQILKPSIESHPTIHRLRPRFLMVSGISPSDLGLLFQNHPLPPLHNLQMPRGRVSTKPIAASKELKVLWRGQAPSALTGLVPGQMRNRRLRGLCDAPSPRPSLPGFRLPLLPLWASLQLLSPPRPPASSGLLLEGSTLGCPHRRAEMGACPGLHTSFLSRPLLVGRRASASGGSHGAGRGQAAPGPQFCFVLWRRGSGSQPPQF